MNKNIKSTSIMFIQLFIYIFCIMEIHNCIFWEKFYVSVFMRLGCMIVSESILEYIKSKYSPKKSFSKFLYSFTIIFCMFLGYVSAFWLVSPGVTVLWWPLFVAFCFAPNIVYNAKIISKKERTWGEKPKWEKFLIILAIIIMAFTIYQVVLFGMDFYG